MRTVARVAIWETTPFRLGAELLLLIAVLVAECTEVVHRAEGAGSEEELARMKERSPTSSANPPTRLSSQTTPASRRPLGRRAVCS